MSDPFNCPIDIPDRLGGRQLRTRDHDHRKAALACRLDLGIGRITAAVLGYDNFDAVHVEEASFRREVEGSPVHDEARIRRRNVRGHRVDTAYHIGMLPHCAEWGEFLPANRKQYRSSRPVERESGFGDVRYPDPAIARAPQPRWAFEPDDPAAGEPGCRGRVCGDARGKGVGRVDDKRYLCLAYEGGKAVRPAEASGPDATGLRGGLRRATGEGKRDVGAAAPRETFGEPPCFAGSAENEQVRDGHHVF